MSKPSQLYLLADHIKLSLLERQRARALHLDDDTQDGYLLRSLDQFRAGLASLHQEKQRLEQAGDDGSAKPIANALSDLQRQFDDLNAQFHGFSSPSTEATLNQANSEELADDFAHASSISAAAPATRKPKSVRFSDSTSSPPGGLFGPYHDDPRTTGSAGYRDQAEGMSNEQLHDYHSQILEEQDEHLERLGESIGRQRELSMQIGDELDSHVAMLDEVEAVTDRHQSRLDRARRTLGKVAKGAGENKQMTAIIILIVILVLLIAILK